LKPDISHRPFAEIVDDLMLGPHLTDEPLEQGVAFLRKKHDDHFIVGPQINLPVMPREAASDVFEEGFALLDVEFNDASGLIDSTLMPYPIYSCNMKT